MNMITGNTYLADVQIKSPMGWVKRQPVPLCCSTPKLPFGVLQLSIEVDIDGSGAVTGIANAPRHRPMPIKGQLTAAD